ncbi:group II intron maturase-specific domain-containing protein [Micromonospora sp. WMMD1102]|uniref:group II intron maturase-specific domain-containing protein n=1 Tax=Micromonospora sp. WMMD1102 TaxID=3016105 RepID=UPI0024158495|nr:group II intron maturase-specific domain-containing protein [Micromonospora sp. WMMD1102]MDG4790492.1 group II intron maturase-specific domain-containing protein [Micromonospora sp. WMMD1102]
MLTKLGQLMRGWANYFKHAVAKWTFSKLDAFTWWRLAHMLRARHGWNWVSSAVTYAALTGGDGSRRTGSSTTGSPWV